MYCVKCMWRLSTSVYVTPILMAIYSICIRLGVEKKNKVRLLPISLATCCLSDGQRRTYVLALDPNDGHCKLMQCKSEPKILKPETIYVNERKVFSENFIIKIL